MVHSSLIVTLLAFVSCHQINAFGVVGHQLIAEVASTYLTAEASAQIDRILDHRPLSSIAAWADTIKRLPQYKFSSRLHYINFPNDDPPNSCQFAWEAPGGQELIAAIHNYTQILKYAERDSWKESEALRFLTHFVEDSHQPLHLSGRARGGNDLAVQFDGHRINLHRVWDSAGLIKRMRTVANQDQNRLSALIAVIPGFEQRTFRISQDPSTQLVQQYRRYILDLMRTDTFGSLFKQWLTCPSTSSVHGCSEYWSKDISKINCDYVWRDVEADQALPPSYWQRIEEDLVFENLIMKSALRLASILNSVFEFRALIKD